ncbi:hypothetical protein JT689_01510 (plasmid) [Halobacterium sp. GSL-19]|uniref:hypothetical protein n=1 Tax=Halobacterium sp. GSL-19 TaxID=2812551 RepID=UPI00196497F8|nr:hypothetical protein [Halobacterium sp. GSL-19]QRY21767.1 hypothetical protein JT689_01510 [Halobacterium sp. GSL-19]
MTDDSLGCPECAPETDGMVVYSPPPASAPDSFNDLEHGTEYYFCDVCFLEWVDADWYNEVVDGGRSA